MLIVKQDAKLEKQTDKARAKTGERPRSWSRIAIYRIDGWDLTVRHDCIGAIRTGWVGCVAWLPYTGGRVGQFGPSLSSNDGMPRHVFNRMVEMRDAENARRKRIGLMT